MLFLLNIIIIIIIIIIIKDERLPQRLFVIRFWLLSHFLYFSTLLLKFGFVCFDMNFSTDTCPARNCNGSYINGPCSKSCGGGTMMQTYMITVPSANGGASCSALNGSIAVANCSTNPCRMPFKKKKRVWVILRFVEGSWQVDKDCVFACLTILL